MPEQDDVDRRLRRLETVQSEDHRLAQAVEGLGGQVGDIHVLLGQVNIQAEQLRQIEKKAVTAETKAERARQDRKKLALRVLVGVPLLTYIAVGAHEVYRDECENTLLTPAAWCEYVFPFDESVNDGAGNPVQRAVIDLARANHEQCLDLNRRSDVLVNVLDGFRRPENAQRIDNAVQQLNETKEDCDKDFPLPEERQKTRH